MRFRRCKLAAVYTSAAGVGVVLFTDVPEKCLACKATSDALCLWGLFVQSLSACLGVRLCRLSHQNFRTTNSGRDTYCPQLQSNSLRVQAAHHLCCHSSCVPTGKHQPEDQTCAHPEILSETRDTKHPVAIWKLRQLCLPHCANTKDERPSAQIWTPNCKSVSSK